MSKDANSSSCATTTTAKKMVKFSEIIEERIIRVLRTASTEHNDQERLIIETQTSHLPHPDSDQTTTHSNVVYRNTKQHVSLKSITDEVIKQEFKTIATLHLADQKAKSKMAREQKKRERESKPPLTSAQEEFERAPTPTLEDYEAQTSIAATDQMEEPDKKHRRINNTQSSGIGL